MHARIATFKGDPANLDEAIDSVRGEVASDQPPEGLESARGMMMLVDRQSGKGLGITFFDSEEDMRRGDEALNKMSPSGGGSRQSVEFYEVAVQRMR